MAQGIRNDCPEIDSDQRLWHAMDTFIGDEITREETGIYRRSGRRHCNQATVGVL
jgi:hypothetical protein